MPPKRQPPRPRTPAEPLAGRRRQPLLWRQRSPPADALCGQADQARLALADSERLMERLDEGQRADTWFGYPEQKHHVHMGHALTVLGETGRARESQQRALELSAPTSTMSRTLLSLDAATCAHRDGDTEQGCRQATAVFAALPPAYRTGLTRTRAIDSLPLHPGIQPPRTRCAGLEGGTRGMKPRRRRSLPLGPPHVGGCGYGDDVLSTVVVAACTDSAPRWNAGVALLRQPVTGTGIRLPCTSRTRS